MENIKNLDYFYSVSTMMNGDVHYEINCDDNKCIMKYKPQRFSMEEAKEYEITKEDLLKIEEILTKYKVYKWDDFNKSDTRVLDGNSFHFYVTYGDNIRISASGYMMYPKNYREVKKELEDILLKYVQEGDFKYE